MGFSSSSSDCQERIKAYYGDMATMPVKDWKKIPKVELHCHLEGSVSLPQIIQEFSRLGLPLPSSEELHLREHFLMESPAGSLSLFLEKLHRSQLVFSDAAGIERIARDLVAHKFEDGVKLLEIRYSPCYLRQWNSLSLADIHAAVKKGVNQGVELCKSEIAVGLICIGEAGTSEKYLEEAIEFTLENREDFVGFDNAGPEINLGAFQASFRRIRNEGLGLTIHAAEDVVTGKPQNALDAVKILGASRVGHGIQLWNFPDALDVIRREDVLLEICPSSNIVTGSAYSIQDHPVKFLYDSGVKLSISTDDPGVCSCTLSGEYALLSSQFGFTEEDFLRINRWALEKSFLANEITDSIRTKFFT